MSRYNKIVESASEKMYEDEKLRSNLTDSEAKVLMDWAVGWVEQRVNTARDEASAKKIAQAETTRVRGAVSAMNAMAKNSTMPKMSEARAALGLPKQFAKTNQPPSREKMFSQLTKELSAAWQAKGKPTTKPMRGRLSK